MNKSKSRKISITFKVTAWYALLLAVILISSAVFIGISDRRISKQYAEQKLIATVQTVSENVEYENGNVGISSAAQSVCLAEGVEIALFDQSRTQIYGGTAIHSSQIDLEHQTLQAFGENGDDFYVYDIMTQIDGCGTVWVRGIFATTSLTSTAALNTEVFFFMLPIMLLIVIGAGYLTTKIAFNPINKIIQTANSINSGNDLNQRINLADSVSPNDEIFQLSETFDLMFDRLQKSFESEKRFSDNASHELQTPIAVIISQCEYLLECNELSDESRQSLNSVLKQARKMSTLISELLMLSRSDGGRLKLCCDEFNLSETVYMICEDMALQAEQKGIEIITDIEDNIIINADQTLIIRLVLNLISNAVKYGRSGGFVKVCLEKKGDIIRGKVEDNGIGIAADDIDKIWQRFYRVDNAKSAGAGYGLGLPLAKMIIEAHKGAISVRSQYAAGTVFSFTLSQNSENSAEKI